MRNTAANLNRSVSNSNALEVHNRQQHRWVDCRHLENILRALLVDLKKEASQLEINIVDAAGMSRLNEKFLRHRGPTDVLAFDYRESMDHDALFGELFLCVDEATVQATRFGTTWQSELVRYAVHGILHLLGYDDHKPERRREMKRLENRLLKGLAGRFALKKLGAKPGPSRASARRAIRSGKKNEQKLAKSTSR